MDDKLVDKVDDSKFKYVERKPTKAQRRKEKKQEEANNRRKNAIASDQKGAECSQGRIEADELAKVLTQRHLQLVDIAPDGDCLYNAIVHQMKLFTMPELRQKAATYMQSHKEDFLPFLMNSENQSLDKFNFDEYCANLLKPGHWGGEPELRALSSALKRKIEVLYADGRVTTFGDEFRFSSAPLIITYHRFAYALGEHYNSTAPID